MQNSRKIITIMCNAPLPQINFINFDICTRLLIIFREKIRSYINYLMDIYWMILILNRFINKNNKYVFYTYLILTPFLHKAV